MLARRTGTTLIPVAPAITAARSNYTIFDRISCYRMSRWRNTRNWKHQRSPPPYQWSSTCSKTNRVVVGMVVMDNIYILNTYNIIYDSGAFTCDNTTSPTNLCTAIYIYIQWCNTTILHPRHPQLQYTIYILRLYIYICV